MNFPGAFADYVLIPKSNVWRHTGRVDPEIAALFDPFGNAVHTALKFPMVGEDVLITGAGPIGLMATAVARHAGARKIVVTDLNPLRLQLALRMGATRVVDVRSEKLSDVKADLGMREGFDVALEFSGSPKALEQILAHTIHGANIAILGLPSEPFAIDWSVVVVNMLNLKGIYGREIFETWYKMGVLIEAGIDISPIITHRFSADRYRDAFASLEEAGAAKAMMTWT